MACGCKNKAANAGNSVAKTIPAQESKPQKGSKDTRIMVREIR